jgi:hypothetical protein
LGVGTEVEYEQKASAFLLAPAATRGIRECIRKHGDLVRYDPSTDEFGVLSSLGVIRTYYIAVPCHTLAPPTPMLDCHKGGLSNWDYFLSECKK